MILTRGEKIRSNSNIGSCCEANAWATRGKTSSQVPSNATDSMRVLPLCALE